jgi:succinate-semialdehyde dehydrogenase/glutarate-semialdehyde dehydrogenase
MPSADVDRAAAVATTARCQNNGQSCIAAKRFIIHTHVYDRFVEAFVGQPRRNASPRTWTLAWSSSTV